METQEPALRPLYTERYAACFELYLRYGGTQFRRIEREMRALGFTDFHRRILYDRNERGTTQPGWPARFGWKAFLTSSGADADAPSTASPEPAAPSAPHVPPGSPKGSAVPSPLHNARQGSASPPPDFAAWLKQVSPGLTWDWAYQKYIYRHLQRVTDGTCKRLMIFMPPRHGKSELVTVRYAGWRLWNDPQMRVIVASYNQKLADRFSRGIRRLLSEEEDKLSGRAGQTVAAVNYGPNDHNPNAATQLRPPSEQPRCDNSPVPGRMFPRTRTINTASQWETAVGGGVKAVGVGAGVTGFGGQLIIIDDPVKSRAEAESETYRERLWDWYNNDLYTRLEPGAAIVLIQTRWHQDDLAGRLLKEMEDGGDPWEIIDLPALAEPRPPYSATRERTLAMNNPNEHEAEHTENPDPLGRPIGKALCPDRFDETKLAEIQRQLGTYSFAALYQQQPTPAEGGIFKREWFTRFVDAAPPGLSWKRGYDLAVSTKTSSCFTASLRVAVDEATGVMYIADGFRERVEYPDQKRYILGRIAAEPDTEHGIEKALHGEALIQELRREAATFGKTVRGITVTADKITRALAWAPLAEEGKIALVRGPWNRGFLDELAHFPAGPHDDQIDAVSLAYSMHRPKGGRFWSF